MFDLAVVVVCCCRGGIVVAAVHCPCLLVVVSDLVFAGLGVSVGGARRSLAAPERFGTARATETHRSPVVLGGSPRGPCFPSSRSLFGALVKASNLQIFRPRVRFCGSCWHAADQGRRVHRGQPEPGAGSDLAAAFKGATYKIMLVANKYQAGSTSHCSRRCASTKALRGHCRADAVAAQPYPSHCGRRTQAQDIRHRLREQARGHPGCVRAVLHERHPGDRDRSVRRLPPLHQARPGWYLWAGAGARGRRTVGHPEGQQRALGRDQPSQERVRPSLRGRGRSRRQGHPQHSRPVPQGRRHSRPTLRLS